MKKYTNRIKLMPKFTKCMSLAMILTFTGYEEAFAEMSYAEQTSFTVSMENQTLKSVINWVEKNSQFIFIYRTDIDLSRRVNVDVRNKTIEEVLKQMFAGTDLEYHIRDRQVIIRKAISREETPPIVMQQEKVTVKGIVTDAKGEAIIGANIIEKGTTNGTITDIDGQFTLMVSEKASLVFSYIGYLTQEMVVGKKPFLNVQLQEDNKTLDEVVITGYGGTQLRSKMTNSIAKVDNSTLSTGVHTNPAQALSGAVAGLRVQQTSGNPNSTPTLVLRGGTNLDGSGSPLVIIDGAVRESLSDVNPEDIESLEVMKDAGATAIYGARASNGVILVTTKRGSEGHTEINLSAKVGFNFFHSQYEFLNAHDYLYYMRSAFYRSSHIWQDKSGAWHGFASDATLSGTQPYGTGNRYFDEKGNVLNGNKDNTAVWGVMNYTDDLAFLLKQGWQTMDDPVNPGQKLIYCDNQLKDYNIKSPAITQDYNLSVSGGNDKGHYYASLGYNRSEGNAMNNWYHRLNFTINADYKIKPWLTSNSSLTFTDAKWDDGGAGYAGEGDFFSTTLSVPPTFRVKSPDGDWLAGPAVASYARGWTTVKVYEDALNYDNNTDKFNLSQSFTFNIMKGLTFKTTGTWFYFDDSREFFKGDYIVATGPVYDTNHSTSNKHERLLDQTYNGILNYQTSFWQDHSIDAMAGVEYYDSYKKGFSASGYGSPLSDFQDLNYTSTAAGVRQIDSWHYRQRILSFFGRVNYDYKSKYLLSLVLRRDGYSKLPKDNRWGTFPGISAGWVLSRENFMESCSNVLSYAKIRASYGANGNVSGVLDANGNVVTGLDYYTVQGSYGIMKDKDGKIVPNYNGKVPLMINDLPNPTMRWEKSYTFETGFDIGFLNNKYILNFTYYNRRTQDKFAEITLPSHSGVSSFLSNNGEVQNQGMELELTANVLRTKDWKFTVSMNTAYNKNKIISLPYNGLPNNMQDAYQVYTGRKLADGTYERQWVGGYQEGQEYGVIYAFKSLGIYKSESEIPGNLIDRSTYTENGADAKVLYGPEAWAKLSDAEKEKGLPIQAGDVKWQDVNGDGVIDDYDRVKLGNTIPHWTGGFNINTSWKGLTLNCRLDYALGYWVHDWKTPWIMGNMQGTFNTISLVKDSWSESNPNGKYPVYGWADFLGKRNYDRISDINCYRGDYLAFREISLSYSLPQSWIHKSGLSKVDVSVTAQNLGYITAAKNMATPEYGVSQNGGYPLSRTVVLGLNVTF